MSRIRLITEGNIAKPVQVITESKGNGKELYVSGIWAEFDIVNKNNREYKSEWMIPIFEKYILEKVNTNRAWGELNHPQNLEINPDRISHRIVELKRDGSNYVGKAIICDTPCGNLVKGLITSGGQVAVSTRGGGDVISDSRGVDVIDEEFYLTTAGDIVLDPSAPSAFVNGIMEGVEWVRADGKFTKKALGEYKKEIDLIAKQTKYIKENRATKYGILLENYIKELVKRKI